MEHHNHTVDSPNPLGTRNTRENEAANTQASPRSPCFRGASSFYPAPFPANSRDIVLRGSNSATLFPDRTFTSANWRNTNSANSQSSRNYNYNTKGFNAASQLPAPYESNRQLPDMAGNMTSLPTAPQADNIQGRTAQEGTGNTGTIPNTQVTDSAAAVVEAVKALTLGTNQQQPEGECSGQTEMPYYAYCFDRGNGQYTRLIPADMLPPLVDIPPLQQGCLGMTVLPCPNGLAPNGRSSNLERVFVQVRCGI
jgi:hypothetical protein